MKRPAVLVIGGLDPTGQAGLARDLSVFAGERLQACPVSTGATVQTSQTFAAANPTSIDVMVAQAEAAMEEFDISWAKVGAIFTARQVEAVANLVRDHALKVVLDPVLSSSSGAPFLDATGLQALRTKLLPASFLVTPNQQEAQALTDEPLPERAAAALVGLGAKAALVKRSGSGPDVLFDGHSTHEFAVAPQAGVHRGTGCRLASRITTLLARGVGLVEAIQHAQAELQRELAFDAAEQDLDGERLAHWRELESWLPRILAAIRYDDVPEVGMNIAYALPGAKDPRRDVLGLAGRITIAGFSHAVTGRLAYGGPHHTGRIAVVLQEYSPTARLVMNHRYSKDYVGNAKKAGMVVGDFDRTQEPPGAPSTMEWGIRDAIEAKGGRVPDLIWDAGGIGKEAMIRIIATDPADLLRKLRDLHVSNLA